MSERTNRPIRRAVHWLRGHVVAIVVDVLILIVLAALVFAVWELAVTVFEAVTSGSGGAFKYITTEVLTVFIFIEIFHSLVEYLRHHRVRVTHLLDASLAFVLREVWVALYSGHAEWGLVIAMSVLVLALGIVRTLAVVFSPAPAASAPRA